MNDDWLKVQAVAAPAGALAIIVAIGRGIIEQQGGWQAWLGGMVGAMLVSVPVALGLVSAGVGIYAQTAIVIVCAYVSRDIITGVRLLSTMMASNPFGFVAKFRAMLRGDKETP